MRFFSARNFLPGLALLVCLLAPLRAEPVMTSSPSTEVPQVAKKYSLTDKIETFTDDYMFKPKRPYEVIPGKDPNGWSFMLEPYAWATGMEGQVGVKGLPSGHINFSPKTVLQNLDWGIFARGEIRKGRWGVMADGFFAQLSGSADPQGKFYSSANLVVQQSMVSLALAYRVFECKQGFVDLYAGARYNYLGLNLDLNVNAAVAGEIGGDVANRVSSAIVSDATSKVSAAVNAKISAIEGEFTSALASAKSAAATARQDVASDVSSALLSAEQRDIKRHLIDAIRPDRRTDPRNDRRVREGVDLFRDKALARVAEPVREQFRTYVRAEVDYRVAVERSRIAAAKGVLTADIVNAENAAKAAADKAKGDLANAVAGALENNLGGSASGTEWWFDPIFGMRAQVNFTRWLYLGVQSDVGGFGAGSRVAWFAQAAFGVNFTRNLFGELGYRYMYTDYQNNGFLYQVNQFGIFAGLGVRF